MTKTDEDEKPADAAPDSLVEEGKELFQECVEAEQDNRDTAVEDLRFSRLDEQWPEVVIKDRNLLGRPTLTHNRLPTFIRQVVNDARQNKPAIKVHPADSKADPQTAEIYNDLIRNIEVTSRADAAYDTALEHAASCGFGFFRVNTKYPCDDTFDLDVVIERISNPFSVYGDPFSEAVDSSDWNRAFITSQLSRREFRRKYKGAAEVDFETLGYSGLKAPWAEGDKLQIAEWFSREKVKKPLLLLSNGVAMLEDVYAKQKDQLDAQGVTVIQTRTVPSWRVTQRVMSGVEILEDNEWAGRYIPIIPVYGEEINVDGKRYFRSLIHRAKDAQIMFNYWRTTATEIVARAPRVPYIGPKGAFSTDKEKWETANTDLHAYIEYDGPQAPQLQQFASIPAAAMQEALSASDDIKSVLGIYDASLGARSNETSGVAIRARKLEGDVSNFHFIDNLSRGIAHCGRILLDLIPHVYTGERIIRVLGQDNAPRNVQLGTPVPQMDAQGNPVTNPDGTNALRIFDLAVGKYDLTVETGPSYTTKREEAADQMIELVRAYPGVAPIMGDLIAKNLDWPGADEIAKRIETMQQMMMQKQGGDAKQSAPPQQDPSALAKVQVDAQKNAADAEVSRLKLQIDAFKAQTDRLKAIADLQEQRMRGMTANMPMPQTMIPNTN